MERPLPDPRGRRDGDATPSTDAAEVLARVACGDAEALGLFYDRTRRRAFGLALRVLGDRAEAEEALLEAYEQVWRTASTFDATRGAAEAWLLRITRTRALDRVRSRGRRARRFVAAEAAESAPATSPGPFEAVATTEQSARLRGAVRALPPAQREAVETAYFGGLSYAEAATALSVPVGTFKTRMRAALATLRAAWDAPDGPQEPR